MEFLGTMFGGAVFLAVLITIVVLGVYFWAWLIVIPFVITGYMLGRAWDRKENDSER